MDILIKQTDLLNKIGLELNTDNLINSNFKKKFSKNPFIAHRNPSKDLLNLVYNINSTEWNKTKGGLLYGKGTSSDY